MTNHKIIFGDSRNLSHMADRSVELVVTSPPYWQLKDYGTPDQLGFNHSYEDYINNLNLVWSECNRVLKDGCRMCINIGDQFARSVYYGRYKVIPIRTEIIRFCETLGLDYMGAIIWQKTTTTNTSGGGAIMGSFPYPRNGILKIDYEFILLFKKQGKPPAPSRQAKADSVISKEEWKEYFSSHWHFGGARQDGHIAVFPQELPSRLIKMFTFAGETVFDPFLGSGTTSLAAANLGRNSVGSEINPRFRPVIEEKLGLNQLSISRDYSVEFAEAGGAPPADFGALPYVFSDPHKMDKKVDVKALQFGSKLDKEGKKLEDYFTVKAVLSPNRLRLSSGEEITLLGILPKAGSEEQAMEYLTATLNKKRVFLRFDEQNKSRDGSRLCYLYLANKTFVNNHLARTGLVEIDDSIEYKHQKKFKESGQKDGDKRTIANPGVADEIKGEILRMKHMEE